MDAQRYGPPKYWLMYYERRLIAEPLGTKPPEGTELRRAGPFHSESDALAYVGRVYHESPGVCIELWKDDERLHDDAAMRKILGIATALSKNAPPERGE